MLLHYDFDHIVRQSAYLRVRIIRGGFKIPFGILTPWNVPN